MPIDFEKFVEWAEKKFDKIVVSGREIRVNSIFAESDTKQHLWCNPDGGKNQVPSGVYHCWKTDKSGTLVGLVMQVDKCSRQQALEILGLKAHTGRPIDQINFEFDDASESFGSILAQENWKTLDLPPSTFLIEKAPENWYQKAKSYLDKRKLDTKGLYVCTGGKYFGRIIIPYYSPENKLIYFNGRTIVDDELRYRGPEKDLGVGKEDVLFFSYYPKPCDQVFLCEGEFDAMSLTKAGFCGVACGGKNLSDKQASMLSNYKICLALDADDAGQGAINNMLLKLNAFCSINPQNRMSEVKPPQQYKDWNNFLCNHDTRIVQGYIQKTEKELESENPYGIRETKKKSGIF